jgi:hypothetical protein
VGTPQLTPSVIPQRMSDCVLFPASTSRNRVGSSWAGRESYLSLVDGTCTHIRPRVQPFPVVGFGWLVYVRTEYRDSTNNESHYHSYYAPTGLAPQTVIYYLPPATHENGVTSGKKTSPWPPQIYPESTF